MELCYPLQGFGHVEYPELLRESSIKAVSKKGDVESPNDHIHYFKINIS